MNKRSITILDHDTNKTETFEVEGYVLLGVKERNEDGFQCAQFMDQVNAKEVAQMVAGLFENQPQIKKAYLIEELGGAVGGMLQKMMGEQDDDCNCAKCVARRAAAKEKENAN